MARKKTGKMKPKRLTRPPGEASDQNIDRKVSFNGILLCMVAIYFLYYLFNLFSFMDDVHFWADENVHAYISSVVFETGRLPASLPEDVYGGFEYSYPPFFHIINAGLLAIAGSPILKYTNLILLVAFLVVFFLILQKLYGLEVSMVACLLISLSPVIAINSIRFRTEMLSMVLTFASVFGWLLSMRTDKTTYAVISGVATGLLILSKQIGIVVLGFYCFCFIWFIFKQPQTAKRQLYAIITALCVVLPYFVWALVYRVEIFGFVSLFFGNKPDWAISAVTSFRSQASAFKEFLYLFYDGNGLAVCLSLSFPLYHFTRTRMSDFPQNCIFLMALYLAGVMIIWHITNSRHTITLLPMVTFLAGYSFTRSIVHKTVRRGMVILLLALAGYNTYQMPDYRQVFNAPPEARKMALEIKRHHQTAQRTLAIEAFDYLMLTGKPVIWPYPNLNKIPVDLFEDITPFELYALFKAYDIDLVLINTRYVLQSDEYMGRNYPLIFVRNCELLEKLNNVRLKALSESKTLILLEVI